MIVNCPWCQKMVWVSEMNCKIFRHGVMKKTFTQLNPHASEDECMKAVNDDLIFGCGGPFMIDKNNYAIRCTFEDKLLE